MFLSSGKRIHATHLMVTHDFENAEWTCEGDAKELRAYRDNLAKIDGLRGPKERIYEWAQMRWETIGEGFTVEDVKNLIEKSIQASRTHVRVMESMGVIFQCDEIKTVTKPRPVYLPSEYKGEYESNRKQRKQKETPDFSPKTLPAREKETKETKETPERRYVIPCHPLGTAVEYNGHNGWRVVEANLANGMHVIEKDGLRRKDLRKDDLPIHINENEEL